MAQHTRDVTHLDLCSLTHTHPVCLAKSLHSIPYDFYLQYLSLSPSLSYTNTICHTYAHNPLLPLTPSYSLPLSLPSFLSTFLSLSLSLPPSEGKCQLWAKLGLAVPHPPSLLPSSKQANTHTHSLIHTLSECRSSQQLGVSSVPQAYYE